MNPRNQHRDYVESLMKNPEKARKEEERVRRAAEIAENRERALHDINSTPELVNTVLGSNAGAGSGDFHTYKHAKRKLVEREESFARSEHQENEAADFALKRAQMSAKDSSKTAKNRLKRQRRKGNGTKAPAPGPLPQDGQSHSRSAGPATGTSVNAAAQAPIGSSIGSQAPVGPDTASKDGLESDFVSPTDASETASTATKPTPEPKTKKGVTIIENFF